MNPDERVERLGRMRGELVARLVALGASRDQIVEAARGANVDDEHDPEGATIAFEREQLSALSRGTTAQLAQVDAKLSEVDADLAELSEAAKVEPVAAPSLPPVEPDKNGLVWGGLAVGLQRAQEGPRSRDGLSWDPPRHYPSESRGK